MSGLEDLPARRSRLAVTVPYYQFREILTVREADAARYRALADLRGRRVATLGATLAYDLLIEAQNAHGLIPVTYFILHSDPCLLSRRFKSPKGKGSRCTPP